MAGDPKNPVVGEFLFDATEFEAYAVDLPPGGTAGMVTTREDFMLVCMEILTNQPTWGALAGITEQEIENLAKANTRIARIDVFIPALRKALEILTETRYLLDDQRQRIVLNAAQSVDRRAKRKPELLAKFERTRAYRSAIARKAVKTRAKNAEAKASRTSPASATPSD